MKQVKDFSEQDLYIGIDVHKNNWSVSIVSEYSEFKPLILDADAVVLSRYLQKHFPGGRYQAVYEAGFSGFQPGKVLTALGINCMVVHPADVPTTDKEKKRKSDPVDSKKLARALKAKELESIYIPDDEQLQDRSILRCRDQLTKDLTRCKNRIKSFLHCHNILIPEHFSGAWSKSFVNWLEKVAVFNPALQLLLDQYKLTGQQAKAATRQLTELSKSDKYKENILLLRSIPGIGILSAITLVIEIGDIHRFSRFDQLCAFVGLIPNRHQSGQNDRSGKITSRGKKLLKNYIVEASWIAIKRDPELMARFADLCKRMPKNKAIIRIAKNMLSRIKAVLDGKQPYQINYNLSKL